MTTKLIGLLALSALTALPVEALSLAAQRDFDPERAFAALKRRLDKNLDGKITEGEFDRSKRAFKRFDVDGDGAITLEDVKARRGQGKKGETKKGGGDPPKGDGMGETSVGGPFSADAIDFFESRIRPVLANECFSCHAEGGRRKGGLVLDSRHGFLSGGESGAALVPGDTESSLFIEAIRYDDLGFAMPPKNKLSDQEIADLEAWVRMGAPWPDEVPPSMDEMVDATPRDFSGEHEEKSLNRDIDIEAGREFWSFQPVVRPEPPLFEDDSWSRGAIDRFLLGSMQQAGVEPIDDADDRTWLRRVTFDLTGLPPTPAEIAAYAEDDSEARDAAVVDRLLGSPEYAERWGRHWLDVARYGESSGKDRNVLYPHAWRYRDWVLEAFRQDMPYDEFLRLQIAGDLMPAESATEEAWNQIATGFLAIGPKGHGTRDAVTFELETVDEQIDAMSRGMLGLTISCARCHDHKFDPIPTADYYALAGIFMSTDTHFGTFKAAGNNQASDLVQLSKEAGLPHGPSMAPGIMTVLRRGLDKLESQIDEGTMKKEMGELSEDQLARLRRRLRDDQLGLYDDLFSRFDENGRAMATNLLAMGATEGEARDIAILERGELDRPGEVVQRRMPQVLSAAGAGEVEEGSGRLELANFIASETNPLTPRVWANRIWLHMFGTGLVPTPDNFGAGGQAPTHPELLDWLAAELIEQEWSTKGLIREIALSRAYRLDSQGERANEAVDPDVVWLWRMPERRLESEALRDAMLVLSGTLSPERPVGSASGAMEGGLRSELIVGLMLQEKPVRSVYLPSPRGFVMDSLEAFDAPDAEFVTGDRDETTVPTQALYLMNGAEVLRYSDAFAKRLLAQEGSTTQRIRSAFELAYGRLPNTTEVQVVKSFLRDYERDFRRSVDADAKEAEKEEPKSRKARERAARRAKRLAERLAKERALRGDPEPLESAEHAAWSAFAQSLFQSAEFRVIG